jgi:hypothetical protein
MMDSHATAGLGDHGATSPSAGWTAFKDAILDDLLSAGLPLDYVEASLTYVCRGGGKPRIHIPPAGGGARREPGRYESHEVRIHDMRPIAGSLSLDRQGFALRHHDTAVVDFYDEEEVRAVYYPEIVALLKQAVGAEEVLVFDHTIRVDDALRREEKGTRAPVRALHNDYTVKSGPQRVRDLVEPERVEEWLSGRFAVINVWRPITGPVEQAPLAVADAASLAEGDLVAADLVYDDRVGEIYDVAHDPGHRWYYAPDMERDEVLLLKCYDSSEDGRARFTPHSAFDLPDGAPGARPRESIEIRTLVRFPDIDDGW